MIFFYISCILFFFIFFIFLLFFYLFHFFFFFFFFFFFQAEDGIRDADVTGVQTCALPIYICIFDCIPQNICQALLNHLLVMLYQHMMSMNLNCPQMNIGRIQHRGMALAFCTFLSFLALYPLVPDRTKCGPYLSQFQTNSVDRLLYSPLYHFALNYYSLDFLYMKLE